jgi:hypothetical protein
MSRIFFFVLFFFFFFALSGYSQSERVFLSLDKCSCRAGDTLYFKGYTFKGKYPTSPSTNLYVDLFSAHGKLLSRATFPSFEGFSLGELKIPDSLGTDNYYLRAFTRYQLNFDTANCFVMPITVYNSEKSKSVFHKRAVPYSDTVTAGYVGGIYWATVIEHDHLQSLLEPGPDVHTRKLRLEKSVNRDSIFVADIMLDSGQARKYILIFPVDSTKDLESLLLFEDSTLIGRQYLHVRRTPATVSISADTLDVSSSGYNSWEIQMPDTLLYSASISVTDAALSESPPTSINSLVRSHTDDLSVPIKQLDTSYIQLQGKATRESGKTIKDPFSQDMVIAGVRDTNYVFTKVIPLDKYGNFVIDSLFFFGDLDLHYRINKEDDGTTANVRLNLTKFVSPSVDTLSLADSWQDDSSATISADSSLWRKEPTIYSPGKVKTLAPVVVKGWRSIRKELDERYTTGEFSEPALYSFDVRAETRWHDLGDYLRANCPRFQGGYGPGDKPTEPFGHPLLFYKDQTNYSWGELYDMTDWRDIAYIKVFESDFIGSDDFTRQQNGIAHGFTFDSPLSSAVGAKLRSPVDKTPVIIALYSRKDKDYRNVAGGMKSIKVKGYGEIFPFHPDRITLYWDPFAYGNKFRVRFNNATGAQRFRVVVDGVDAQGHVIHHEEIVE